MRIRERVTQGPTVTSEVPGVRVVAAVPLTGSQRLLNAKPSQHFV